MSAVAVRADDDDDEHSHQDAFDAEGALGWTAAEKQAGHDQRLAMTSIRQLAAISLGLKELAGRDSTACNWMNQPTGPETLATQVRAFEANTRVKDVIHNARMTVREYLLTLHAVSEAAIAVHATEQQIQVSVKPSPANVGFYRSHREEIEKLLDAPDPC